MRRSLLLMCVLAAALLARESFGGERKIGRQELLDKTTGFWVGQLVGNTTRSAPSSIRQRADSGKLAS